MGYGGMMGSGAGNRPPDISRSEWAAIIQVRDEDAHSMVALYLRFGLIVFGGILIAITIASLIYE